MKRMILTAVMLMAAFALVSCGGSSGSSTTTASTETTATDTFKSIDTTMESVTPQVTFTAANSSLASWSDWRDAADDSTQVVGGEYVGSAVLEKLLSDSAESVFAPAAFLAEITTTMATVDALGFTEWDTGGTVTATGTDPETGQTGTITVTITIPTTAITIPTYFQDKVETAVQDSIVAAVNRILEFSHGDWEITMAIGEDTDYYYAVATAVNDALNETQTFIGYMNRTSEAMTLHYASADDDNAEGGLYTRWIGNNTEEWFKIAQVSGSAGGNQEIVGGGENMAAAGSIAFKTRNNSDDSGDSSDVYYMADLTTANIEDGTDPGVAPTLGEPTTGTGSIEYIIEGNDKCLGWIGKELYPANRAAIAWSVQ